MESYITKKVKIIFNDTYVHATYVLIHVLVILEEFRNIILGVVHKLSFQEEGGRWSKKLTFCKLLYQRKYKRKGIGGQKKPNFVNIVCECPLLVKWQAK